MEDYNLNLLQNDITNTSIQHFVEMSAQSFHSAINKPTKITEDSATLLDEKHK